MYAPKKTVTRRMRVEYEIETPCTAKDIYDTIHVITTDIETRKGKGAANWDDAWHAKPSDESIIFYYEYTEAV